MPANGLLTDIKTIRARARHTIESILAQEEEHAEDLVALLAELDTGAGTTRGPRHAKGH